MDRILSQHAEPASDSIQERVRRALEAEIIAGIRPPGSAIDEKALAQDFKASRTPVREALLLLAGQGLVRIVPRSGIYVYKAGAAELVAALEALVELETVLARLAAQRITGPLGEAMERALEGTRECARASDREGYERANATLHELIYRTAGNAILVEQVRQVRRKLAAYRQRGFDSPGRLAVSAREHADIVEAIRQGDGPRAGEAMRRHISAGGEALTALILAADAAAAD